MAADLLRALHGPSAVVLMLCLLLFPAQAQTSRGTVTGTVLDSSGGVIPSSVVELTNVDTGVVRTTTTNGAGIYRFDAVDLGMYRIKISIQGFKTFLHESFPVEANRTVTIDATLEPGGIEAIVEVTSTSETSLAKDAPLLGGSISGNELIRLPFTWGEPHQAVLLPGTVLAPFGNANFGHSVDYSVNGQRPRGNNYMLDGTDNNWVMGGGTAQTFGMLDAIQESSVQTGNFGVEFGRAGGGVFNLITKSGTNKFHGTLSWRLLSQVFDSIDNFLKLNTPRGEKPTKPVYTENIYGFTLGGPILKGKTFFFGGFQQDSRRSTASFSSVLPTEDAVTKLKTLFPNNPRLNIYLNALGSARGVANPTNIILGNDPLTGVERGTVQFATTYFSLPAGQGKPQMIFRLDRNLSDIHRLSFRYIYDSSTSSFSNFLFPGYYTDSKSRNQNFLFNDNYTFGPNWTNEFRFSYSRTGEGTFVGSNVVPEAYTLPKPLIPRVSSPGLGVFPILDYANKWLFQETQSKLAGRHTLRFGFEFVRQISKERPRFNDRGMLTYTDSISPSYSAFANCRKDLCWTLPTSVRPAISSLSARTSTCGS
jgi:hypothetical protein